ncbi:MAG: flap endonuclease-1 [Candidatus Aenigmarchaeota archaeon]|nr:flap endonuclease-1 [Candidatus Aenigmarchaeota archaeon]
MGVQISNILPKKEIALEDLANKRIAVDSFNTIFQFLSVIRDKDTGQPLRDSKGRITSHLSGLFYRTLKWSETGIKPIFVFDGEYPKFKRNTVKEREEKREESLRKWTEAVEEGRKEDIMTYAQASSRLTSEIIDESKKLLDCLGVPWIQAPSEGEAQASFLVKNGEAYAVGSQDTDSLLFGSERLIRNLSITGKRKLPRQEKWIEVKPLLFDLQLILSELNITKEQLIILGMLVGTDYSPEGVKGIGPKNALKLVTEHKDLDKILNHVEWTSKTNPHEIYDFFISPPTSKDYKIEWKDPNKESVVKLMSDEHDFSEERISKSLDKLMEIKKAGAQTGLSNWFKK